MGSESDTDTSSETEQKQSPCSDMHPTTKTNYTENHQTVNHHSYPPLACKDTSPGRNMEWGKHSDTDTSSETEWESGSSTHVPSSGSQANKIYQLPALDENRIKLFEKHFPNMAAEYQRLLSKPEITKSDFQRFSRMDPGGFSLFGCIVSM